MSGRPFPNAVAVYSDQFVFTTLTSKEVAAHLRNPYVHPNNGRPCDLISLDQEMDYVSFAKDHGPLNLAYTCTACIRIHDELERTKSRRALCVYTTTEPKTKSNMMLVVALYWMIVQHQEPHQALAPINSWEVMPFRDAGCGPSDYSLSIQDCLYGIWKARRYGLIDLAEFDAHEYQYYETVANGDLNVLGPFIPFASPMEEHWAMAAERRAREASHAARRPGLRSSGPGGSIQMPTWEQLSKGINTKHSFECVMDIFKRESVGLVVRLNDELYDRKRFIDAGIDHIEMYFDDGSNPTDEIIRDFIKMSETVIEGKSQKVAVHCKAGLGRTGVLIGAYFIYKYGFTAQEVIGFMRIVRPGMVVGGQQHFMLLNQMKWAGWAARDIAIREIAAAQPVAGPLATPPMESEPIFARSTPRPQGATRSSSRPRPLVLPKRASSEGLHKHGDAAGQPRKSPQRTSSEEVSEVDVGHRSPLETTRLSVPTPSPARALRSSSDEELRTPRAPTAPPAVHLSAETNSYRGTKRGAGRSPIPFATGSSNDIHATRIPQPAHGTRSSSLPRPSSMMSIDSVATSEYDDRPKKRPTQSSPSAYSHHGLSSPPPSRESSPLVQALEKVAEELSEEGWGHPKRREAKTTSSRPPPALTTPPKSASPLPDTRPTAPLTVPSKRSFLPVRRVSPPKTTPSTVEAVIGKDHRVLEPTATSTPKKSKDQELPRRRGLTPPKFARDMLGFTKLGSRPSTPAAQAIASPTRA